MEHFCWYRFLENLEGAELDETGRPKLAQRVSSQDQEGNRQLSLFGAQNHVLLDRIRELDIASMTPLEALNKLEEMQGRLRKERER